jgi:hypothetical protein
LSRASRVGSGVLILRPESRSSQRDTVCCSSRDVPGARRVSTSASAAVREAAAPRKTTSSVDSPGPSSTVRAAPRGGTSLHRCAGESRQPPERCAAVAARTPVGRRRVAPASAPSCRTRTTPRTGGGRCSGRRARPGWHRSRCRSDAGCAPARRPASTPRRRRPRSADAAGPRSKDRAGTPSPPRRRPAPGSRGSGGLRAGARRSSFPGHVGPRCARRRRVARASASRPRQTRDPGGRGRRSSDR